MESNKIIIAVFSDLEAGQINLFTQWLAEKAADLSHSQSGTVSMTQSLIKEIVNGAVLSDLKNRQLIILLSCLKTQLKPDPEVASIIDTIKTNLNRTMRGARINFLSALAVSDDKTTSKDEKTDIFPINTCSTANSINERFLTRTSMPEEILTLVKTIQSAQKLLKEKKFVPAIPIYFSALHQLRKQKNNTSSFGLNLGELEAKIIRTIGMTICLNYCDETIKTICQSNRDPKPIIELVVTANNEVKNLLAPDCFLLSYNLLVLLMKFFSELPSTNCNKPTILFEVVNGARYVWLAMPDDNNIQEYKNKVLHLFLLTSCSLIDYHTNLGLKNSDVIARDGAFKTAVHFYEKFIKDITTTLTVEQKNRLDPDLTIQTAIIELEKSKIMALFNSEGSDVRVSFDNFSFFQTSAANTMQPILANSSDEEKESGDTKEEDDEAEFVEANAEKKSHKRQASSESEGTEQKSLEKKFRSI